MLPDGIASTSWPSTRETCRRIGIEFDPWQRDLNRCILGKDSGGLYAADTVAMSIPRQVGKTFDVGGLTFADSIINPGTTTVWTAHRFKVARESFNEMRGWAKKPQLKAHIEYDDITTAAGNECIPFRNGSRIVFAARERGAIRGFTKVRRLVLDEGQILTEMALADLVPTMNQAVNPQIILMGTPPKPTDPGEVFQRFRAEALAGLSTGLLYVEFSAPAGSDPLDRQAWRLANPSYPSRTPARAILRLYKLLSPEDYLREALGIWDEDAKAGALVIAAEVWELDLDRASSITDGSARFGLDVAPDQSWSAIAAAGTNSAGMTHVELTGRGGQLDYRPGTDWVVPTLADMRTRHPSLRVAIVGDSGAKALRAELERAGVPVDVLDGADIKAACGLFYAKATAGDRLRHIGQEPLTDAMKAARKQRTDGETAWRWGRKRSTGDITPLYAATVAVWQAEKALDLTQHPVNNVW